MTTVAETIQAAESPLRDPARTGEANGVAGRARWRLDGGAGAVVLLVDGPDDLMGWPPELTAALLDRGLRVLSYETIGCAGSYPAAVADVALAVLDSAGVERAHVVAASAGGLAAQVLGSRHASRVLSLCLLMTRLPSGMARDALVDVLERLAPSVRATTPTAARAVAITRHNAALSAVASARPGQRARARRRATAAFERGFDPVDALRRFATGDDDPTPMGGAGIPAAVIHGRHDTIVSTDDAATLAENYRAALFVVPSRHDLPWGVEDEIADRVASLATSTVGPAPPAEEDRRRRWPRRLAWSAAALVLVTVASVVAAASISVPYYAIRPGSARQTNDLVVIPADKKITPKGQFLFVTVGVQRLHALQYLVAKRDQDVDVVPEEAILGKANPKEYQQRSTQAMVDSKETAAVIALQRLCLTVTEKGTGARIEQVADGSPAASAGLEPEDTIIAIGKTDVTTADQALKPLRALKPGSPFSLTVAGPEDGSAPRTVTGTLGKNPTDANRSYLGVVLRTRSQDFDLPFDIGLESGRVGGPSAGLAFTLSLLDQLTPGELTGGVKVAATGTIELDGTVGLVGGVPQKAVAVRRSGAKLFLVPSAELAVAKAKIGSTVDVLPVDTLEEALVALKSHGGDVSGIPATCPGS